MIPIQGSLLDSDCDYICHQVNCQGKMNSGVAKAIRDKWPVVYNEYMKHYVHTYDMFAGIVNERLASISTAKELLGQVQIVPINEKQNVVNLFSQENYGYDGKRYTSYDAFYDALVRLRDTTSADSSYAFPYRIGSDRGGANWWIIRTMIEEVFDGRKVYIYYLGEVPENEK